MVKNHLGAGVEAHMPEYIHILLNFSHKMSVM